MSVLLQIIISTFIISAIAFSGVITLFLKPKMFKKILLGLVALSAGALMGGAFLHLIPEAVEQFNNFNNFNIYLYVLIGFTLFFIIEKVLGWRHCHEPNCKIHTFAYMNLIGEVVHNFIDGLIIAASYVVNTHLGIVTTLAVALHEIPQEIGDFGVLVYAGFNKKKALILNFLVALTVILGGIVGYYLSSFVQSSIMFLLPFAAGGFIYIASSDLIPELRKEKNIKKSILTLSIFLLGIILMLGVKLL
jgi:zinc and cadmium transporter